MEIQFKYIAILKQFSFYMYFYYNLLVKKIFGYWLSCLDD